jgi:hypothetical protein
MRGAEEGIVGGMEGGEDEKRRGERVVNRNRIKGDFSVV